MSNSMVIGMKHTYKKRLKLFIATFALLLTLCCAKMNVLAAGESAALSGGGSVSEGDIVNVSLTANCSDSVWGYEAVLSYDSSVLQFLSTSGGTVNGGNGQISITGTSAQAGSQTVTIAFKAVDKGASAVSLIQCIVSNGDSEVNCSGSAVSVSVAAPAPAPAPAPEDDVNGDATLSSLTVSQGSLSPAFNPWTFWYELEVEEGTDSIVVSAKTSDPSSEVIAVNGSKSIEHGENVVTVVTEASGGARLTYTIMVYCGVHADGTEMDSFEGKVKETAVSVGGTQYIISDKISQEDIPSGYKKALASLNGQNILVLNNSKMGLSLALLKKGEEGDASLFVFEEQSGTLYPYFKIGLNDKKSIVLLQPEANAVVADGMKLMVSAVLGESFYCCQGNEENIYYFYTVDQDGNRSWYSYDDLDKTYQRYDMEAKVKAGKELAEIKAEFKKNQEMKQIFMIATIAAGVVIIILAIVVIVIISKRRIDDDEEIDDEIAEEEVAEEEVAEEEVAEDEVAEDEVAEDVTDDQETEVAENEFADATESRQIESVSLDDTDEVIEIDRVLDAEDIIVAYNGDGNDEETEVTQVETSQESRQIAGKAEEITVDSDEEKAKNSWQVVSSDEEDKAEEEKIEGFVAIDLSTVEELISQENSVKEPVSYDTFHRSLDADLIEMELERSRKKTEPEIKDVFETPAEVEPDDDYKTAEVEPDDDYKTAEVEPDDDYARVSTRHKDKKEETVKVEFEFIDFDD